MAESSSGGTSGYESRQLPATPQFFKPVQQQAVVGGLSGGSAGAQVQGGNSRQGTVAPQADPVQGYGDLGNVIEKIMAPKTAALQKEQFWKGVTAARSGEAITDIVDSQSPLAKIFGPSNYVQGAQFYAAQERLASYNQNMIATADELANVPPDTLGERLNKDSAAFQTGDPGTDALIQQSWIEQTGPALNVIMRTRFAQQQTAAKQAFISNASTNAGLLQDLGKKVGLGTATQDDYTTQMQITAQAHMIPAGMTAETYREFIPQVAKEYADKGNFHAVNLLKASGALGHLELDKRTKLDEYIDKKEKAEAQRVRYENAPQLAMLVGGLRSGAVTASQYNEEIKKMTGDFQRATGVIDTPLVPFSEQESNLTTGVTNWYEGQAKMAAQTRALSEKASTEAEKEAVKARTAQQISLLIAAGSAGEAIALYGLPKHEVDANFVAAVQTVGPEAGDKMLINNWTGDKYVNDIIKNRLSQGIRATVSGDYSPAVEKMHSDWKRLVSQPEGAATAGAYYDSEDRIRLERYDSLLAVGQPAPVAFAVAFRDPLTIPVDDKKRFGDDKEIRGVIKDRFTTWFGQTNDQRTQLDDFSQRLVGNLVKNNIQTALANTGLSVQQATRAEVSNLLANGLENFGGHAWMKQPNQAPLSSYIRSGKHGDQNLNAVPPGTLDKLFGEHIRNGMVAAGNKDVEAYQVVRLSDAQGRANFAVIGYTKDGQYAKPYSFNSEDLSKTYEERLQGKVKLNVPKVGADGKRIKEPGLLAPVLPDNKYRFIEQAPARIY